MPFLAVGSSGSRPYLLTLVLLCVFVGVYFVIGVQTFDLEPIFLSFLKNLGNYLGPILTLFSFQKSAFSDEIVVRVIAYFT